jgi:hypothetical protein
MTSLTSLLEEDSEGVTHAHKGTLYNSDRDLAKRLILEVAPKNDVAFFKGPYTWMIFLDRNRYGEESQQDVHNDLRSTLGKRKWLVEASNSPNVLCYPFHEKVILWFRFEDDKRNTRLKIIVLPESLRQWLPVITTEGGYVEMSIWPTSD